MARRDTPFDQLVSRFGRLAAGLAVLTGVVSILAAVLGPMWLGIFDLEEWGHFTPALLFRGQIWRLVTYPWFAMGPIALLLAIWVLLIFVPTLEGIWGERRLMIRMAVLGLAPLLIVSLLSIPFPVLRGFPVSGPWVIMSGLVVAFASALPTQPILFFFIIRLAGDQILMAEAVVLALSVLFTGSVLPFVLPIVSFLFALGWFRFGALSRFRRSWLLFRKGRIESRMKQARRRSGLRVVSSRDDDDEPKQYLH